jgi:hypothetical protein
VAGASAGDAVVNGTESELASCMAVPGIEVKQNKKTATNTVSLPG